MNKEGKAENRCSCWFCGSEMIWGCDFNFEDYGLDGDGIVATLTCSGCEATAEFYTKFES
jgi:transcription elongation factor Elf1